MLNILLSFVQMENELNVSSRGKASKQPNRTNKKHNTRLINLYAYLLSKVYFWIYILMCDSVDARARMCSCL